MGCTYARGMASALNLNWGFLTAILWSKRTPAVRLAAICSCISFSFRNTGHILFSSTNSFRKIVRLLVEDLFHTCFLIFQSATFGPAAWWDPATHWPGIWLDRVIFVDISLRMSSRNGVADLTILWSFHWLWKSSRNDRLVFFGFVDRHREIWFTSTCSKMWWEPNRGSNYARAAEAEDAQPYY